MVVEKMGIAETKELVIDIVGFGNTLGKALEDKKISAFEWVKILTKLVPIYKDVKDFGIIWEEIKDIDTEEIDDIKAVVIAEFDIPQDTVEEEIKKYLVLISELLASLAKTYNL